MDSFFIFYFLFVLNIYSLLFYFLLIVITNLYIILFISLFYHYIIYLFIIYFIHIYSILFTYIYFYPLLFSSISFAFIFYSLCCFYSQSIGISTCYLPFLRPSFLLFSSFSLALILGSTAIKWTFPTTSINSCRLCSLTGLHFLLQSLVPSFSLSWVFHFFLSCLGLQDKGMNLLNTSFHVQASDRKSWTMELRVHSSTFCSVFRLFFF